MDFIQGVHAVRFSLLPVAVLLVSSSASLCTAAAGPDLVPTWRRAELLAPAPKPNQRTTIEGTFTVRNVGDMTAPPSRVSVYLRPDRPRINVRDPRVSRFLQSLDVPLLVPGQVWNGRIAVGLEPGLDAAGLRLTVVANSSGTVPDGERGNDEATSSVIAALPVD